MHSTCLTLPFLVLKFIHLIKLTMKLNIDIANDLIQFENSLKEAQKNGILLTKQISREELLALSTNDYHEYLLNLPDDKLVKECSFPVDSEQVIDNLSKAKIWENPETYEKYLSVFYRLMDLKASNSSIFDDEEIRSFSMAPTYTFSDVIRVGVKIDAFSI